MQIKPQKALNPAYRKHKPLRSDVSHFFEALKTCMASILLSDQKGESEEHLKEPIKQFFQELIDINLIENRSKPKLS